jgi:hypothetical protein
LNIFKIWTFFKFEHLWNFYVWIFFKCLNIFMFEQY